MSTPVPREFVGLARAFRNRVAAADARVAAVVPGIVGQLRAHAHGMRNGKLSKLDMQVALRAWQTGVTDSYMLDARLRTERRRFTVAELRATCDRMTAGAAWNGAEQDAVALSWHAIQLHDRLVDYLIRPVATMTLHALARRFERGDGREDSNVVQDLAPLAAYAAADKTAVAPPPTLPVTAEVRVSDGRWAGRWVVARDAARRRDFRIFQVQTFLDDEMEYSNAHP